MVERGIDRAGAVKPAAAATAAVARRARLEGAGPVDHHRSRNESAAGRSRSPRPGSWFDASPDCSLRTGCAFPRPRAPISSCDPIGRITSHPVGWRTPAPKSLMHEGEGLGKGGALLGKRRLAAMGPHGHRPPGPAEPARNRSADGLSVCDSALQGGALRDDALGGKPPQRDQKLSRDGDDRDPPDAAAPGPNERGKPVADR